MKKIYMLLCSTLLFTACASSSENLDDMTAEDLYNVSWENLEKTKYEKAATGFEKLETDHPYSKWAVKAKLMGAYAYYKNEKYDDAVLALDRFIKYHPGNKDVAYAYYLKGMCYYDQITSAEKDQSDTAKAEETFLLLTELFPDSKYAEDARKKINLTEDYRAGQEMNVARYYLKDGNYLSALNRFNVVLENYQTTVQIEEALYREVEIYAIFGMDKYADGYYNILKKNYPDGKWTAKAKKIMKKLGKTKAEKVVKENSVAELKSAEEEKDVKPIEEAAEEAKTEQSFWSKTADFLWPWGKDDSAEEEIKESSENEIKPVEESAEEAKTEQSFWSKTADFLWPWGKDDSAEEEIKESSENEIKPIEEAAEEAKTEQSFWSKTADFLWPWGKDDNTEEEAKR
ncbi:MAG: outer membrane protein assembly factor BamD [Alphaproteobacteria bacterium]|nr:outer membrane protein assembly factor BamD [Alphaproteobacteria bacterium]